jgi:ribosomal protein S18 acetylase RimI-like enzyme
VHVLLIRAFETDEARALSAWLLGQPAGYLRFFQPFSFDAQTIERLLSARQRDCWMGVWGPSGLVAFFMLRGFDEGYTIPSYGVAVDAQAQGLGIGRLTLVTSKTMSRLLGAPRIMLKVHPDNRGARTLYESEGFVETGVDTRNGNLVYHHDLQPSGQRVLERLKPLRQRES